MAELMLWFQSHKQYNYVIQTLSHHAVAALFRLFFLLSFPLFLFTSLSETVNNRPNLVCYTSVVVNCNVHMSFKLVCWRSWYLDFYSYRGHYFRAHKKMLSNASIIFGDQFNCAVAGVAWFFLFTSSVAS